MSSEREYVYATNVSCRQLVLLREIKRAGGISVSRMCEISQTTGGSVVRRKFVAWNGTLKLFTLTPGGNNVVDTYNSFDISRGNHNAPLSSFIADKYGDLQASAERQRRKSRRAAA